MYPPGRSVFFGGYLCSVSFYDCVIKGRLSSISCLQAIFRRAHLPLRCVYLCARTIKTVAPYLHLANVYKREASSPFMPATNIQMILSTERYRTYSLGYVRNYRAMESRELFIRVSATGNNIKTGGLNVINKHLENPNLYYYLV